MNKSAWLPLALSGVLTLTACGTLPRAAGLQTEVLTAGDSSTTTETASGLVVTSDFAIAPVTREQLPEYARWPRSGASDLHWIDRVDQPATRIIAPGDTLTVTIWNTEDIGLLTAPGQRFVTLPPARVSSSGTVFMPYIGTQRVSGMSPETAREQIEAAYLTVSPSTQVQVELTEGQQNTVSLVSGVAAPGSFPLPDNDFTITGLIALGGGVPESLRNPQIRLQRNGEIFGIALDRMLDNPALDTTLRGGDRVYLESDERQFYSLGAAGSQAMHPFTADTMSAIAALAAIGGVDAGRANPQGILILRRYGAEDVRTDGSGPPHTRMVFVIDLTTADGLFSAGEFLIASDDLVYATESPVTGVRTIFGLIGSAFGLANQIQ